VMLARSGARLHGVAAYASALSLIAQLLESHWLHVYPRLDTADDNDATMRLNALAPLADAGTGLADLRGALVGDARPALTVRQVELAVCKAEPHEGEAIPTLDGVLQGLRMAEAAQAGLLGALRTLCADVARIEAVIAVHVGAARGPDLSPLRVLANALSDIAQRTTSSGGEHAPAITAGTPHVTAPGGAPRSREEVHRLLERACEWLEQHEPAHPAPLLIRRAQRLLGKNFMEIMRDLAPAGVDQVETLAGEAR
jgi:type VI secretion system protein ImpA